MLYNVVMFVHVLMAIIWLGGTTTLQVLVFRAKRARDQFQVARMAQESEWVGTRVLLPVSIILVGMGVWLVSIGTYGWASPFVIAGLSGFSVSVIIGSLLGPMGKKMKDLLEVHGYDDKQVQAQMSRIFMMSRIELAALVVVVFFMVVKPGSPS
jgi:uncharacterized membrane protein